MKKVLRTIRNQAKKRLYFFVAGYFAFFARIYLKRWKPQVITVTGSSGKTTLLHLFEAQLGERAYYSHHANSTFGIPFHLLGFERSTYRVNEWIMFALSAPFCALRPVRTERIYVTEVDAERPGEAAFLSRVLQPDIVVWLSLEEAHGAQFDTNVHITKSDSEAFDRVKTAIAYEFGHLLASARSLVVLNRSNTYIAHEATRTTCEVLWIALDDVKVVRVERDTVTFGVKGEEVSSPHLIPLNAGLSLMAVMCVVRYLGLPFDADFTRMTLPPGRSSVFSGIRTTTLIDSSYNGTMDGMRAMLDLFAHYPVVGEKWLVLGDMIEQGNSESYEHALLAPLIAAVGLSRVVLVGPRLNACTRPALEKLIPAVPIVAFDMPSDAYTYLLQEIKGNETILFKGARYLEGIVERLLLDSSDASKLCRRGEFWDTQRKPWGV